jgi:hypothetical protein
MGYAAWHVLQRFEEPVRQQSLSQEGSPRAFRAWPLAWPSPSGPLGWQGLQGQRRAEGASRIAGCEAPLRLEGPARRMRGVPVPITVHFDSDRRIRRDADRLVVVLAGVATGYGGDHGRPVTGVPCEARRRVRRAIVRRTRAKRAAQQRRVPRVNPCRLRRVTLAALSLPLLAPVLAARSPSRWRSIPWCPTRRH